MKTLSTLSLPVRPLSLAQSKQRAWALPKRTDSNTKNPQAEHKSYKVPLKHRWPKLLVKHLRSSMRGSAKYHGNCCIIHAGKPKPHRDPLQKSPTTGACARCYAPAHTRSTSTSHRQMISIFSSGQFSAKTFIFKRRYSYFVHSYAPRFGKEGKSQDLQLKLNYVFNGLLRFAQIFRCNCPMRTATRRRRQPGYTT